MKLLLTGLLVVFSLSLLTAQVRLQRSTLGSLGNSSVREGVYLSQTVGQPSNTAKFSNRLILSQGFQQAYGIGIKGDIGRGQDIQCEVYPNPFDHYLTIRLNYIGRDMAVHMFTLQGRRLRSYAILSTQQLLDVHDLPYGLYVVVLYRDNQPISVHRVVKLNR